MRYLNWNLFSLIVNELRLIDRTNNREIVELIYRNITYKWYNSYMLKYLIPMIELNMILFGLINDK